MGDFDMFRTRSHFPVRSFENQSDTSTTKYLQETFKIIYSTDDLELLTKVFSGLGFYLLLKNPVEEKFIKCPLLYEKILFVLNSGIQVKTTLALNLISSLLHLAEDESQNNNSLYIYTQNMIRISGCLKAMCSLFTSYMLHKDTLTALCRSVSEVCRGSSTNQSYCSYLVPLCIQKCRYSWEVLSVLQSLLLDHDRNTTLFHECNGMAIFTRDSLQNLECLQLLNTVIENIKYEDQREIRNDSRLFDYLLYLSRKYNGSTLVGKWSSIILYSYRKGYIDKDYFVSNTGKNNKINSSVKVTSAEHNDTNQLFRNILNEIVTLRNQKKQSEDFRTKNTTSNFQTEFIKGISSNTGFVKQRQTFGESVPDEVNNDLTFSFLFEDGTTQKRLCNSQFKTVGNNINLGSKRGNIFTEETNTLFSYSQIDETQKVLHNHTTIENKILIEKDNKITKLFCSTPKPKNMQFSESFRSQNSVSKTFINATGKKSHDISKHKIYKTKQTSEKILNKRLRNKSLSTRFLDIVNASCTTIIKSFTSFQNIFKCKNEEKSYKLSAIRDCNNYSFTDFMYKRDVILHTERNENTGNNGSEMSIENSCNTCNNTIALKQKYLNNLSLQRTIKKLKLGINLYGCDFKKISRTMWPRKKHMTPLVLYNLYRKLIIK